MISRWSSAGFTIVELMVSISIMSVLLSLVLFNYRTFTNRLAVSGSAQELATTIRQTQSYRLAVQEVTPGSGDFTTPYGLHFTKPTTSGLTQSYIIFADRNLNGQYDGSTSVCTPGTECLQKVDTREGVALGYVRGSGGTNCDPTYDNALSIIFNRAVLDAEIGVYNTSASKRTCTSGTLALYKSDPGRSALLSEVTFSNTGQMTVTEPRSCGVPGTVDTPMGLEVCFATFPPFCYTPLTPAMRCTTWSLCPGLRTDCRMIGVASSSRP